ncbi:MAG TPA: carboxypeptidase regulatory-like domain-containing protein [Candidatus Acidoferrales bacterium]|nr:carboxypeptidase regulatory-like domain-containing protein [Candidatus Acidoferrales bacterium]
MERKSVGQRFFKFLACAALAGLLASASHAATVSGTVKGPDGAPFKGAFVIAQNTANRISVSVLSNKEGHYEIPNLPAATYDVRIRAIGYKADPHSDVKLTANQNTSFDWNLQPGMVRWTDLSLYQGKELLPKSKGQEALFNNCFVCHGFQTRMASTTRDEDGWRDRVDYMRSVMDLSPRFNDQTEDDVVTYLTSTFGPDSTKPKSPADLPGYKDTLRTFSDDAMNIVYVEYDVATSPGLPWSANPDKEGNLWMPYYGDGNKVGRLNPKTGEVTFFPLPQEHSAGIHSAIPVADGTVWFTEFFNNKIAHLDPSTKEITEYQDEGAPAGQRPSKHTIRMDPTGKLWMSGSPFSSFDPKTKKFTHYDEVPSTYGVVIDNQGNAWFAVYNKDGAIGKVDAKTGKLTQWPTNSGPAQRLQVADDGTVWFSGRPRKTLGHLDPATGTFKLYDLPGPDPSPYPLNIDKDHMVWYGSTDQDTIGRLDPSTGKVTEYPFPHSEGLMREFFLDGQGRMWFATPTNNRVGYFYLAEPKQSASK